MSDDRPTIGDALRSRWAYSSPLMAVTMLMPVLGIFSRAQEMTPDSPWWLRIVVSIAPGILALVFFSIASRIVLRLLPRPPAFVAVVLWTATGVFVAVSAAVMRQFIPGATVVVPVSSALLVFVTVGTMGLLALARQRLDRHEGQLRQAQNQELRLQRAMEEQRQSGIEQLQALSREVDEVISPEIRRVEQQVSALGQEATTVQVHQLGEDINRVTSTMVRQAGHDVAVGTFREPAADDQQTRSHQLRWRGEGGIWEMVLSAHLTIGAIVILGIYFLIRHASAGCVEPTLLAVGGYGAFALLIYWISTIPMLRQRPWALVLLVGGPLGGFVIMQYLLADDPTCAPAYPGISQGIFLAVALVGLIALSVLIEAGGRARSDAELLTRTNDELAAATVQIQRSQAVTRSQMAQILHGGVQGRLSSISLALRRYVDSEVAGEQPSLTELKKRLDYQLAQVREELTSLTSTIALPRVDLESAIRKLIMQWRGLLAIDYDINVRAADALKTNDYLSWTASEIIDAAITNANQHGDALHVWITVALDSDADVFTVTIEDDGTGPPANVTPGMGLDGIAALGGTWRMEQRSGGGCSLRATLPAY